MKSFVRNANALFILVLMGVIAAAFYQELTKEGPPCPLCFLQRVGMVGVATGLMMNLSLGVRVPHYALSLLSTILGGSVSVRQILLHICPGFPVFGTPVLGYGMYTWAFLVFCSSLLALVVLLFLYRADQKPRAPLNWFQKLANVSLIVITIANLFLAFTTCGFKTCPDPSWPQTTEKGSPS
ncbi:MAG: disulfide bond formation protein B [Simkaniaceae bacterium]|nr:disulfide bond formation protein B [Candidatus Sacchlamyda saccharinae]